MADAMFKTLVEERDAKQSLIRTFIETAQEQGRDLSDQDKSAIEMARTRIGEIDGQLEYVAQSYEMDDKVRERLARLDPQTVKPAPALYRSLGEILFDRLRLDQPASESAQRYRGALARAAQHMGTVAADTTATAGDLAGLVVDPVVGGVVNFTDSSRPFLSAVGTRAVNAYDFRRPYISDAVAATGTTAQTAQKAEVGSTQFSVASDTLEYKTYGEYLNVSAQLLQFDSFGLQIIIDQLRNRVARGAEKAAFTELALSTTKITLSLTAVDNTVSAAIEDGKAKVYDETGMPADWVLMGPTGAARLGKTVDSAGRPLYPYLGPINAPGNNPANGSVNGLRPIVSYAVTTAAMWIGNGGCFEAYEVGLPLMQQVEPSVLGTQVAVASMLAFYRPRSKSGQLGATQLAP